MTMKIHLVETGGWANIRSGCTVDTAMLPDTVAEALLHALVDSRLFLAHDTPADVRDARTIEIIVDCGETSRHTSFSEAAAPDAALPLLEILRPLCRPMPIPHSG
jgi:hypothetical protein